MHRFMNQLGRYFQIFDDYQNLVSQEYTSQRGFCQDLDEGKPSYPFIRACHNVEDSTVLTEWLNMLRRGTGAPMEAKRYILARIEEIGSLEDTRHLLALLLLDLEGMLRDIETVTGQTNWILRSMMMKLQVKPGRPLQKESTFAEVLRVWGGYRDAAWRSRRMN
jgi:geranylgeranyl pyrophosphate synthase